MSERSRELRNQADIAAAAYRASASRYQGFYSSSKHWIMDFNGGRGDPCWEAYGKGDQYQAAHDAMMAEIERLRFVIVVEAILGATFKGDVA